MSFCERHDLYSPDQVTRAAAAIERIRRDDIDIVRFSFVDQHGILRGKALCADEAIRALSEGCAITSTLLLKDTSHRSVYPVFSEGSGLGMRRLQGGADLVMVPNPETFRLLPWAQGNAWVLCDLYFNDGTPVPLSTRQLFGTVLKELEEAGYFLKTGLEVEFHVFRLEDPMLELEHSGHPGKPGEPPRVSLLSQGYQYLTEYRFDQAEPVMQLLRRNLDALGLPVRSVEVEFGPSQFEFTFQAADGIETADNMVLLRSAVKQICRRHGYHATFMCRPVIPNAMASGWHLHQSLVNRTNGDNAFKPGGEGSAVLSQTGMHYLGGLLRHARAGAALAVPTTNGYSRFKPNSLAPDRVAWGLDNRGVMARVLTGTEAAAARIENRTGDPAANPYLYLASQVLAGLDGIRGRIDPGPPVDEPYHSEAEPMPASLGEAVDLLAADDFFRSSLGAVFVDYFCYIKRAEIERFQQQPENWEQREYFELF